MKTKSLKVFRIDTKSMQKIILVKLYHNIAHQKISSTKLHSYGLYYGRKAYVGPSLTPPPKTTVDGSSFYRANIGPATVDGLLVP